MFDSALLTKKIKIETPSFKKDHISQIPALKLLQKLGLYMSDRIKR